MVALSHSNRHAEKGADYRSRSQQAPHLTLTLNALFEAISSSSFPELAIPARLGTE